MMQQDAVQEMIKNSPGFNNVFQRAIKVKQQTERKQ